MDALPSSIDFSAYYINQAGSGLSSYKRTSFPHSQVGSGALWNTVRKFAIPIYKFLATKAVTAGKRAAPHLIQSLAEAGTGAVEKLASRAQSKIDQTGSGRTVKGTTRRRTRRKTTTQKKRPKKSSKKTAAFSALPSRFSTKNLLRKTGNDVFG
jgi:hypothetical protein